MGPLLQAPTTCGLPQFQDVVTPGAYLVGESSRELDVLLAAWRVQLLAYATQSGESVL